MSIYIVSSDYFNNDIFGIYSSLKRAHIAIENFLITSNFVAHFEKCNNYTYKFTIHSLEHFTIKIYYDILDMDFVNGICKDNDD